MEYLMESKVISLNIDDECKTIHEYVERVFERHINAYRSDPQNIVSEYNAEKAFMRDYYGRELLELLQNADDEILTAEKSAVEISYIDGVLKVKNDGNPFSRDGIDSLIHSHLSPKKEKERKTIGNKGLGFRSILSWANKVSIDSGELHIQLSDEIAQQLLKFYFPNLKSNIKAPILPFPKWNDNPTPCEYTTCITIETKKDDRVRSDILYQLTNLKPEILLFLNRTTKLIVKVESNTYLYKKHVSKNGRDVTVNQYDDNGKCIHSDVWYLNKSENNEIGDKLYSVTIAALRNNSNEIQNGYLYSYFPTKIYFPFNYLIHADFDLTSNRNNLEDNETNRIILEEVARLLVDTAIKVHCKKNSDYNALSSLIPSDKNITLGLSRFSFNNVLKKYIMEAELFPLINNKYTSFDKNGLGYYESGLSQYIPAEHFIDILKYTDNSDVENFILDLFEGVSPIFNAETIASRLNDWIASSAIKSKNTQKKLIQLIPLLLEDYTTSDFTNVEFFVDQDGKTIGKEKLIFVSNDDELLSIPDFANVAFISKLQSKTIKDIIASNQLRESTLNRLNVHGFNVSEILKAICDWFYANSNDEKANQYYVKQLRWIWDNYITIKSQSTERHAIYLRARNGKYVMSNNLYMGKEYDNVTMEPILSVGMPNYILEDLSQILNTECEKLIDFLQYFGVAKFPRIRSDSLYKYNYWAFFRFVLQEMKYPLKVSIDNIGYKYDSADELLSDISQVNTRFQLIDSLDVILAKASTTDIFNWILVDKSVRDILEHPYEPTNEFLITRGNQQKSRPLVALSKIRSYVCWLFNTIPWIEVNGKRYDLNHCLLEWDESISLEPRIVSVSVNSFIMDIPGKKSELRKKISNILESIGVKRAFGELSPTVIYSVLRDLPEIEGSETIAAHLYASMMRNSSELIPLLDNVREYKEFIKNGRILCDKGYETIKKAKYIDGKEICSQITRQYPMVAIPRRMNRGNVKTLFGVDRLELKNVMLNKYFIHSKNDVFKKNFETYKQLAFSYRIDSKKDIRDQANKFKAISIILCSSVSLNYQGSIVELEDYEFFLEGTSNYYLCVRETVSSFANNIRLAQSIASIISSYLDVTENTHHFRELYNAYSYDQRMLILKETVDEDQIERACKAMSETFDAASEFFEIFQKLDPHSLIENRALIDQIDFDYFNSSANYPLLIKIFKNSSIDFDDYNDEAPNNSIDLTPYYEQQYMVKLREYEGRYRSSLHLQLQKESVEEQKLFNLKCLEYLKQIPRVINSCDYSAEEAIIKFNSIIPNIKILNMSKLLEDSRKEFFKRITQTEFLKEFFDNDENESLLYFRRYNELERLYEVFVAERTEFEESFEESENVAKTNVEMRDITMVPADNDVSYGENQQLQTGYHTNHKRLSNNLKAGAAGEQLIYEMLKKRYRHVKWVSENAKAAGVNPLGSAGNHYDIEYINDSGELIYVEVKASTTAISKKIQFYLSKDELNFAKEHALNYELYYVAGLKSTPIGTKVNILLNGDTVNTEHFHVDEETNYIFTAKVKNK